MRLQVRAKSRKRSGSWPFGWSPWHSLNVDECAGEYAVHVPAEFLADNAATNVQGNFAGIRYVTVEYKDYKQQWRIAK